MPGRALSRLEASLYLINVLATGLNDPDGSWYLTGTYGNGKTHLLYAQYREVVMAGKIRCHVRTTRELVEELRRAELDDRFVSPPKTSYPKLKQIVPANNSV